MKKRYKILTIITLFSLVSFALPKHTYSQTITPPKKREEVRERLEEAKALRDQKREELTERIQVKKATRQAQLTQKRQQTITSYFNQMSIRIDATIQRLGILISRIESRLIQIETESESVDTSSIMEDIDQAKSILEELSAQNGSTNDTLTEVLASEDPKASFEVLKDSIKDIKLGLLEVHGILTKVIGDIKGLRVGQNS
jgi:HPt (histidine-containing phosphotransfer) domain-containing protein